MTAEPRNERPLHFHDAEEDTAHPWTADTLSAHLQYLHGVDDLPLDRSLENLAALHDGLGHGQPAKTDGRILTEVLAPERRYESITLNAAPAGRRPGESALYFQSAHGSGGTEVILRPADLPALRAAVAGPAAASEVISFLEGLDSGVLPSAKHRAISAVLDILRNEEPA